MSRETDLTGFQTPDLSRTATVPDSVTICVTSCGRWDLLQRTLGSFRRFNAGGRFLLSEDSGDAQMLARIAAAYPDFKVLAGSRRQGLMASIDRVYTQVETPFIFHLEDDWQFEAPVDWPAATTLLQTRQDVANVSVRAFAEIRRKYRARSEPLDVEGRAFRLMRFDAHPESFGWSSNPGLIRADLYHAHAPFARMMHDQMSGRIKACGGRMAYLLPGVARHIGAGRNAHDPTMPARPRHAPAKWLRAAKKKLYYAGWRKAPF